MLVGAVPFDPLQPAQLIVPLEASKLGPLCFAQNDRKRSPIGSRFEIEAVPAPEAYVQGVERALVRLRAGELDKIVLARTLRLTSPEPIHLQQLLHNLALHNTQGYTFAVDLPTLATSKEGSTLIGASPELLVARTGRGIFVNPLAGSTPRSTDPVEDARRAQALLASPKDLREHALVIEAVAEALRPYCEPLHVPATPSLVQT